MKTLFVGNLPWSIDDAQLSEIFSQYGEVASARVLKDGHKSRGLGFVDFADDGAAEAAIQAANGLEVGEEGAKRALVVELARPKEEGSRHGGSRHGDGQRRGGYRGGYNNRDGGSRGGYNGGYSGNTRSF